MLENKKLKSKAISSMIFGIVSIILTVAYCGLCCILDINNVIDIKYTTIMTIFGLVIGIASMFFANLVNSEEKNAYSTAGIICSIVSIAYCVYSLILYNDMIRFWSSIIGA